MSELTPERERQPSRPTVKYLIAVHENLITLAAQGQGLPSVQTARPSAVPVQLRGTVAVPRPGLGGMESVLTSPSMKPSVEAARPSQVPAILKPPDRFRDQLETLFPKFTITPDANFTDEDWRFWQENGVAAFLSSLVDAGLLDRADEGATIRLFREGGGIRINIAGKKPLLPPEETEKEKPDTRSFSLVQDFLPGEEGPSVYVESVVTPRRGRPFVKSGLLAYAEQARVSKIRLQASGIGGSREGVLAWARYGFVPTAQSWRDMRRSGLNKLRRGEEKLPTSVRAELEELLLNPSPRALRWMIYLSWRERKKEVTDFINAVISSNVSWEGELDPTDKNSFSWASTYASVEKAEDALPTFKTLLPILPEERVDPEPEKRETKEEIEEEEPVTDDVIELLALGINEGESTITDLYEEYKHRPDVIARVEKLLLRSQ